MDEITGPGAGLKYGYPQHSDIWGPGYNRSMRLLDWITMPTVIGGLTQTPPNTTQPGWAYFTGAVPTGAWAGHPNVIALRTDDPGEPWFFLQQQPGWVVNVFDEVNGVPALVPKAWDGTQWVIYGAGGASSYPIAFGNSTEPNPSASEDNSVALSKGAVTAWPGDVALGVNATTEVGSRADWEPGPGGGAQENASSIALGYGASATAVNAVALGPHSVASIDDTISVGVTGDNPNEPEFVRRIVNVEYAQNLFDAVPLGQMMDLGGSFATVLDGATAEYAPYVRKILVTSFEDGPNQAFTLSPEDLQIGSRLRAIGYRVIEAHPSVTELNVGQLPQSGTGAWSDNLTNADGPIPFTTGAQGMYILDKPGSANFELQRIIFSTQDAAVNFPKGVNLYTMELVLFFDRFNVSWTS